MNNNDINLCSYCNNNVFFHNFAWNNVGKFGFNWLKCGTFFIKQARMRVVQDVIVISLNEN